MNILDFTTAIPNMYHVAWWDVAGPGNVNCDVFAIDCGSEVILIDSGRGGSSYPILKSNLQSLNLWDRLSKCFITHMHRDHAGGIPHLQNDGVQVFSGFSSAQYFDNPKAVEYYSGNVPRIDAVLRDGETISIDSIQVKTVYTPGHTSTCVSYIVVFDKFKCAFSGDLFMPNGSIGSSSSFDFSEKALYSSLIKLLEEDFDSVFTGHFLKSSQPEGFWVTDAKSHIEKTISFGRQGKWNLPK